MTMQEMMQQAPVIPVLVIDDIETAIPLAEALVNGGLTVLEVTLRTPVALEAISLMSKVEGATVGVGTALSKDDLQRSRDCGARFAVSPGYTDALGEAARKLDIPLLPGVATSSDILRALGGGYSQLKFFPAAQAGGTTMLKAFQGPFQGVHFCPTGGICIDNAADYLSLPNVLCVGGSWVAPRSLVKDHRWADITDLAHQGSRLLTCGD